MGIYGLGSGYEFESLPPGTVSALLDPFFLITDQIRFDCLRRLNWAVFPGGRKTDRRISPGHPG